MKKLLIVSGPQGSGKTTYIKKLYRRIPKDWVTYAWAEPNIGIEDGVNLSTPVGWKWFNPGTHIVLDDVGATMGNIIDLLYAPNELIREEKKYCITYAAATQIPKKEFPVSFVKHPDVEFIEMKGGEAFREKLLEEIIKTEEDSL